MMKSALQSLYDSSISYGMKKALVAEQSKSEMNLKIKALEKENKELGRQITYLEEKIERTQEENETERVELSKEHAEVK